MNRFRITFLTSIIASLAILAVPAFAQGFTFGLRPEDQSIGYFQYSLEPGESLEDAVLAVNGTEDPLRLIVTVVAGHTELTGGISFPGEADGPAAWIVLPDEGLVDVPSKLAVRMPFTLTVPEGTPPGEYVAGFMATPEDPSEFSGEVGEGQLQVQVIPQMAVSMIIKVSSPEQCQLEVNSIADEVDKTQWKVLMDMANTGNVHFKGHGEFNLYPLSEDSPILQRAFNIGYFIAGDAVDYPLYFEDIPAEGSYRAEVIINGGDCEFQSQFEQSIELSGEKIQQAADQEGRWADAEQGSLETPVQDFAWLDMLQTLWLVMLGLAGVALVAIVFFIILSTRRRKEEES